MFKIKEGLKLFNNQTTVRYPTGNYGSFEIDGGAKGSYEGYSIGGRVTFMHDNGTATGLYDDVNNKWMLLAYLNGETRLYHSGTQKLATKSGGVTVNGTLTADSLVGSINYNQISNPPSIPDGNLYVRKSGDTMTGALTLSGATDLNFLAGSNEDAGDIVWKYHNGNEKHRIWDGGTGLNYRYNGGPSQRIYHQAYHPEADKWTTARTNTVTLTGDATGTGSASVDGTGNWTVSIPAVVANDSHSHSNYLPYGTGGTVNVNSLLGTVLFTGSTGGWANRGPSVNNAGALLSLNTHPGSYYSQLWFDTAGGSFYHRTANNVTPTAAWRKVWDSGNDGSGSGLDADLVDGYHASTGGGGSKIIATNSNGYLYVDNWINTGSGGLFSSVNGAHIYPNNQAGAYGSWRIAGSKDGWYGLYFDSGSNLMMNSAAVGFHRKDIGWQFRWENGVGYVYTGTSGAGTAGTVWHSANDGSGSGLDADLLDGQHGSYYARASHNHTLTLSGDVTGSGSVSGTISVSVNNDSHTHQQVYIPDTRGAARAPSYYPDRYVSFDFQNNSDTAAGGDSWHVLQTIAPWSAYDNSHRQQQLAFTGAGGVKFRYATSDSAWAGWQRMWTSGNDGSGSGLDADLLDGVQGSSFLRSDTNDIYSPKRLDIGSSTNWDSVSFGSQTNVHFQGHNQFWIGAGNGTWFTGGPNSKSQESGLALDASVAHDLLITTMQSTSTYDRGITFGVDSNGTGTFGWRLGKWHSGDARDSSKLVVDGGLFVKGGYTDEYDYYTDDYSAYYSSQGGAAYWGGDSGWNNPSATFSTAIQIQSGNGGTNSRQPQLQFHQYGYGGVQFRYSGPDNHFHLESTAAGRLNWFRNKTDHGYIDIGPANTGTAHIYTDRGTFYFNKQLQVLGSTVWNSGNDGSGSGLDADLLDGIQASRIVYGDGSYKSRSTSTFHNNVSGFHFYSAATNAPTAEWYNWITCRGNSWGDSNEYSFQLAHNFWNNSGFYVRRTQSGTEYGWDKIWTSGNDGSGSGLDADLLDGQHGSYYTSTYTAAHVGLDTSGSSSYPRMFARNNPTGSGDWLRMPTTGGGLLPYSNGNSYVGTSSWRFSQGWFNSLNGGTPWTSSNDGSGSGLDADLLDGQHASAFATSGHGHTGLSSNSWGGLRSSTSSGYIDFGPANTTYAHIYTDRGSFYFNKNLYVSGSKVWHSGNDGSGSGLDADLLDGLQASAFINTASKNASGWHKCTTTGVIIQWARIYVSANSTTTWTYPTAFPTACRSISANQDSSNAGIGDNSQFYSIGSTRATLRNGWNSSATYFNVFAIGY